MRRLQPAELCQVRLLCSFRYGACCPHFECARDGTISILKYQSMTGTSGGMQQQCLVFLPLAAQLVYATRGSRCRYAQAPEKLDAEVRRQFEERTMDRCLTPAHHNHHNHRNTHTHRVAFTAYLDDVATNAQHLLSYEVLPRLAARHVT